MGSATAMLRGLNEVVSDLGTNWKMLANIATSSFGSDGIVQGLIAISKQPRTLKDIEEALAKTGTAALDATSRGLKPLKLSLDDIKTIEADLAKDSKKLWSDRESAAKRAGEAFTKLKADIYEVEKVGAGASLEVYQFGRVLDEAGDTAATAEDLRGARAEALRHREDRREGRDLEV